MIFDGEARDFGSDFPMRTAGILCVFQGFHKGKLGRKQCSHTASFRVRKHKFCPMAEAMGQNCLQPFSADFFGETRYFYAAILCVSQGKIPQSQRKRTAEGLCFLTRNEPNNHSWGPAATRALPASLPVYLTKFLTKRADRSLAFSSQIAGSA